MTNLNVYSGVELNFSIDILSKKMEKIQSFRQLNVWTRSVDFAKDVILMLESSSSQLKLYKLQDQISGSAASVPQNIAEGFGRKSSKEYLQFLHIAKGSLNETVTLLEIFKRTNWANQDQVNHLINESDEIGRMLSSLIKRITQKCNY